MQNVVILIFSLAVGAAGVVAFPVEAQAAQKPTARAASIEVCRSAIQDKYRRTGSRTQVYVAAMQRCRRSGPSAI
jgi:hypothetical protein